MASPVPRSVYIKEKGQLWCLRHNSCPQNNPRCLLDTINIPIPICPPAGERSLIACRFSLFVTENYIRKKYLDEKQREGLLSQAVSLTQYSSRSPNPRRDDISFKNAYVVGYQKAKREFREVKISHQDVFRLTDGSTFSYNGRAFLGIFTLRHANLKIGRA